MDHVILAILKPLDLNVLYVIRLVQMDFVKTPSMVMEDVSLVILDILEVIVLLV